MKALIIEEDKRFAESLDHLLKLNSFEVDIVNDGEDGVAYGKTNIYDFLIVNVKIPKINGYQVARYLRMYMIAAPILMYGEKCDAPDRIEGLNAGADYFLALPLDMNEVLAVTKSLMRRQSNHMSSLQYGNTSLDLTGYTLFTKTAGIHLSAKEFDIMRLLMQQQGRSIKREDLLTRIWGYDAADNNLDVYITYLRRKLRTIGSDLKIKNIRLLGFYLEKCEE